MRAVTPIAFVQAIAQAYRQRGMDISAALAESRIPPELLHDPRARVTAAQFEALSGAAMRELDDEALGWFGRRLPWGSYGMLCRASVSAPTLGIALARWCRHHRLLADDLTLALATGDATATLSIVEHRDLGGLREFCLVSLLRMVHGYAGWLVDSRLPLAEVAFPFAAPPHADAYAAMFPGPIRFGAACAALRLDARDLALVPRRDEAATRAMLQRALALPVRQYRHDRRLVDRVRTLLQQPAWMAADAAAIAAHLHLSERTLHRQLRAEQASLQSLKDAARLAHARDLLERSPRPVKQIAAAVGFRSEKSFARAFRLWSGMTPGMCRHGGRPAPGGLAG